MKGGVIWCIIVWGKLIPQAGRRIQKEVWYSLGSLLELQIISRLQRSVSWWVMSSLEGWLYSVIHLRGPALPTPGCTSKCPWISQSVVCNPSVVEWKFLCLRTQKDGFNPLFSCTAAMIGINLPHASIWIKCKQYQKQCSETLHHISCGPKMPSVPYQKWLHRNHLCLFLDYNSYLTWLVKYSCVCSHCLGKGWLWYYGNIQKRALPHHTHF